MFGHTLWPDHAQMSAWLLPLSARGFPRSAASWSNTGVALGPGGGTTSPGTILVLAILPVPFLGPVLKTLDIGSRNTDTLPVGNLLDGTDAHPVQNLPGRPMYHG
jgi:hypothetical protein